ncbi:hypothetical protein BDV29DRAFT_181245 [Aspergillus leporis]|uniref:RRM domain-containing protein n=1 Tax=Aspergillus leporis TaxID=41062 RepID=A0A5N5WSW2_9EURO|nr:hypothetical protein BDV29DRAFT_181245 [Aspergillus leporis]
MLKPFQIRDLHRSPSQGDLSESLSLDHAMVEDSSIHQSRSLGIVRLSASEYDELAMNHPRARLTYIDDDDGELITVGSSLELSQRLEEHIDTPTPQLVALEPMHIFDIRRSNSVKNLWKKFESRPHLVGLENRNEVDIGPAATDALPPNAQEKSSSSRANSGPATTDDSEPLLAAFEAEMAKIMGATDTLHASNARPEASAETQTRTGPDRRQYPSDAFVHALHNLVEGAEMISAGVRSRLPEFERQLQNAQRTLPGQVGSSVQVALTALDGHARNLVNALNNASAAGGQRAGNLFQAELPTPAATVEGLRNMASELGHMGHTLFEAFESEFRCNASGDQRQGASGDNTGPSVSESTQQAESASAVPVDNPATSSEPQHPDTAANCDNEKEPLRTDTQGAPTRHPESQGASVRPESLPAASRDADPSTDSRQQPGSSSPNVQTQFPSLWNRPRPLPHRPHPSHNFRPPYNKYYPPPALPVPPLPPVFWPHHGQPPHGPPHGPPHDPPHGPPHVPPHGSPHGPPHGPPHGHTHFPSPLPAPDPSHTPPNAPFHFRSCVFPQSPRPPRHRHRVWPSPYQPGQNIDEVSANETAHLSGHHLHSNPTGNSAQTALFIGNVGFSVHEAMVHDVFASKGFLVDVHLPQDAETGRHAGFGYLHFPSIHAAKAAIDALQGTHIDGHSINLEFSDHSPIGMLNLAQGPKETFVQPSRPSELQSSVLSAGARRVSSESQLSGEEQHISMNRRRSAPLTVADLCSGDNPQVNTGASSGDNSLVNSSLLDSERLNTLYPSLLPEGSPRDLTTDISTSTQLPDLTRELEERRFPPVSQLDAHFLAEQHGVGLSIDTPSRTRSTHGRGSGLENNDTSGGAAPRSLPGSFPQDSQDNLQSHLEPLPETLSTEQINNSGRTHAFHHGRRPRATRPFYPSRRHSGPWDSIRPDGAHDTPRPLRRRATEHHSLRDGSHLSSTGTFHRYSYHNDTVPRPSTSTAEGGASRQRGIDDCVSTLASLGYGSVEEGGLQRIAVYAAAVDGRVSDAIEMIEEERKAYEQQGSPR